MKLNKPFMLENCNAICKFCKEEWGKILPQQFERLARLASYHKCLQFWVRAVRVSPHDINEKKVHHAMSQISL